MLTVLEKNAPVSVCLLVKTAGDEKRLKIGQNSNTGEKISQPGEMFTFLYNPMTKG